MNKNIKLAIIPVMLSFFAMGFVDIVGIASNYGKGRPLSHRFCSKHISFLGILLVSNLQYTNGYADE